MSRDKDGRKSEFVKAATTVFENRGVSNTTIRDVTESMGVTRSLFYHYFQDKTDLVDAVIDEYVDDFIEHVCYWVRAESIDCPRAKLTHIVSLIRDYFMGSNPFHNSIGQKGDMVLFHQFTVRCAERLSEFYERDFKAGSEHTLDADVRHPRESYYLLTVGLMGLLNQEPTIPDEVIVDLICDTLHIPA